MNYGTVIKHLQKSICDAQAALNELQRINLVDVTEIRSTEYITRQEAADILKKGLRQTDRDCRMAGIKRKREGNVVLINKRDLLKFMGILPIVEEVGEKSEFDKILLRKASL